MEYRESRGLAPQQGCDPAHVAQDRLCISWSTLCSVSLHRHAHLCGSFAVTEHHMYRFWDALKATFLPRSISCPIQTAAYFSFSLHWLMSYLCCKHLAFIQLCLSTYHSLYIHVAVPLFVLCIYYFTYKLFQSFLIVWLWFWYILPASF